MLKRIGIAARQEIEAMSGRKVFLQLKVKVRKNWRDDEKVLKSFGYLILLRDRWDAAQANRSRKSRRRQ